MFLCSIIPVPLFHHQMLHSSTIRCSTVPPPDVPLFHCSPISVLLFHYQLAMFYHQMLKCSGIKCSTVPLLLPSDVSLFHRSTMCSSLRCSIVPPSLFYCFSMIVLLLHHLCSLSLREGLCTEKNKGFSSS